MPNTLIPIQTYTLTSATASVTFTNIPQNYTDLKIVMSARSSSATTAAGIRFNLDSGNNYSSRRVGGDGTTTYSASPSSTSYLQWLIVPFSGATASVFGNAEIYVPNYTSSTQKSALYDSVSENNSSAKDAANLELNTGIWANTSAINSITIINADGNFVTNSTFTLYGISNGVKATGGTLTVAGGYAYHTFTSTSSFLPNQRIKGAEILCIAGGGGAAGGDGNGGGGGGGLLYAPAQTLIAGNLYTAVVGSGGTASAINTATRGSDSIFGSLVAKGGGASPPNAVGSNNTNGGSGAGCSYASGYAYTTGVGTVGQGNNGGNGAIIISNYALGGGGGGAGAAGSDSTPSGVVGSNASGVGGNGGNGSSAYSVWGAVTGTGQNIGGVRWYAGGGGGGTDNRIGGTNTGGQGGYGGGGAGGTDGAAGTAGTANTGGGGGGGGYNGSFNLGGAGGSGIIIVRYPLDSRV